VPVPWAGAAAPFGFSPEAATGAPWLPQPAWFAQYSAAVQQHDPASMLEHYREVLRVRREHPALGDGTLEWIEASPGVLAFRREPGFVCVVNFTAEPQPLPTYGNVLVASVPLEGGLLAADAAVWLG
jgi:alpha-glucosidase